MGPLISAMPRTRYAGAFSDPNANTDPSTSKLLGSNEEDDEMLARQMASRLTQRLGMAIFVSCSFAAAPAMDGESGSLIQHRAAALAEREIYRILRSKQEALVEVEGAGKGDHTAKS